MNKCWIGCDNGVSGSIGITTNYNVTEYIVMPTKKCLNYTKAVSWIRRIDVVALENILSKYTDHLQKCLIERPMVNPMRFKASVSALRAFEATVIILDRLQIAYDVIDSKIWQKALLPAGLKGPELKEASLQTTLRLFPKIDLGKFDDGDGLLIAEYCKRTYNQ